MVEVEQVRRAHLADGAWSLIEVRKACIREERLD